MNRITELERGLGRALRYLWHQAMHVDGTAFELAQQCQREMGGEYSKAINRTLELVTSERLQQMVRSYKAARSEIDTFPEIANTPLEDRFLIRKAIRYLAE